MLFFARNKCFFQPTRPTGFNVFGIAVWIAQISGAGQPWLILTASIGTVHVGTWVVLEVLRKKLGWDNHADKRGFVEMQEHGGMGFATQM